MIEVPNLQLSSRVFRYINSYFDGWKPFALLGFGMQIQSGLHKVWQQKLVWRRNRLTLEIIVNQAVLKNVKLYAEDAE